MSKQLTYTSVIVLRFLKKNAKILCINDIISLQPIHLTVFQIQILQKNMSTDAKNCNNFKFLMPLIQKIYSVNLHIDSNISLIQKLFARCMQL